MALSKNTKHQKEPEVEEDQNEAVSSEHDRTPPLMNSQRLQSSTQDQPNEHSSVEEALMIPTPT